MGKFDWLIAIVAVGAIGYFAWNAWINNPNTPGQIDQWLKSPQGQKLLQQAQQYKSKFANISVA